ncbi:MAG TPA: hypothetical protein VF469_03125 [Kofleriaceae bacterium]
MAEIARFAGKRIAAIAAAIAVLGFIGLGIGLAVDPDRAWLSYLMAYWLVFSVSVGGLILLMIGYAANARWMSVVRRLTEVVALPLPALAVLFVGLPLGAAWLYPWRTPPAHATPHQLEVLAHRKPYLNLGFFTVRGAIYFAILIAASYLLRRWSVRRDAATGERPADPEVALGRERKLASAMLPPVGLAFTFAVIDWVMSLEPLWYSSIFGIYAFAGGFVAAIGLVTVLAARAWASGATGGKLTPNHFHALGRLAFAFTVFWAYNAFFQALLIRIANKPEEVTYYLARVHGAWAVFVVVLILGRFALPFLVLLPRAPKFWPRAMAAVGWWLVAMHLIDVYWQVIPSHVQGDQVFSWLDLAALAAVIGTAVAVAALRQHGVPIVPLRDPFVDQGAAYRSTT